MYKGVGQHPPKQLGNPQASRHGAAKPFRHKGKLAHQSNTRIKATLEARFSPGDIGLPDDNDQKQDNHRWRQGVYGVGRRVGHGLFP